MALFQPINPASLVEQQFFAPESKFNVLGGIQGVIEQGRSLKHSTKARYWDLKQSKPFDQC